MRNNGYCEKKTWYADGYKSVKFQQVEMIQRHYTDYSENDWVLWIVADLFHPYNATDITGSIEIKKYDGSIIKVPFMLRTPYPNKRIRQLSMKSGRKRLYGIPLVFKTFEKLCAVSDITIRWDIYEEWYLGKICDKPLDLCIKNLTIRYSLSFKKDSLNPDYHFFTVSSKDNTYIYSENDVDKSDTYYNEFDIAINTVGTIICEDEYWEPIICDIFTLKKNNTAAYQKVLNEICSITQDKEKIKVLLQDVTVDSEIQWEAYQYEKAETLQATFMADILPESSFGFCGLKKFYESRNNMLGESRRE